MWVPDDDLELDLPLPRIKMPNGKIYQDSMHDYQMDFHADTSKYRAIVGSVASGKSAMGTIEVFQHCWEFRDNFGFVLRETMSQNRLASIRDFKKLCPKFLIRSQNSDDGTITMLNQYGYAFMRAGGHKLRPRKQDEILEEIGGTSMVVFTSFEGTRDALQKWSSSTIGFYFMDQAERANEDIYEMLNQRLRHQPSRRQAWFCANWREDVPIESEWLWRLFSGESPEKRPNHSYREVLTEVNDDNLPDDFTKSLDYAQSEHKKALYVRGEKEKKISSTVFPDYSSNVHVIPHRDPEPQWIKGLGLDHGLHHPTAFVQVALLPTGEIYVYDEYESSGSIVAVHAKELLRRKTRQHLYWAIDPTCVNRESIPGMSVSYTYQCYGLPFQCGPREVAPGISRLRERFAFDPERINPFTQEQGSPSIFISERCESLRKQILGYRYEENKTHIGHKTASVKPHKYNDHLIDALRFIVMLIPGPQSVVSESSSFDAQTSRPLDLNPLEDTPVHNERGELDFDPLRQQALRPVSNEPAPKPIHSTSTWLNPSPKPPEPPEKNWLDELRASRSM